MRHLLETLSPPEAAQALVGCTLVKGEMKVQIVEVEAYAGSDDPGSHAFNGMTPRVRAMFGQPGMAYIYFTYGNHWMLNVTARPEGEPCALLIRAAKPMKGEEQMWSRRPKAKRDRDLLSGPGKLAQALDITGDLYGIDLMSTESEMHLIPRQDEPQLLQGVRVGIAEGRGEFTPWRFIDASLAEWASLPRPRMTPPNRALSSR
jgi:DNA-3-methyladenine glycosylase